MKVDNEIKQYINSQPESKASDMNDLHKFMMKILPKAKLSFFDGKDANNKTVSNPTIGYGELTLPLAGGKIRETFQVGISANSSGISVYVMGIKNKNFLPQRYGKHLGKATVTGYCIKFKALKDIDLDQFESAIKEGMKQQNG